MSLPDLLAYPRLVPALQGALEYADGTHRMEDVQAMLVSGHAQLWPGVESAVVTQIVETPQKRLLSIFLAGGRMAEIQGLMPIIYAWAAAQGCTGASFVGRRGWERTFVTKDQGWEAKWTAYTKELG